MNAQIQEHWYEKKSRKGIDSKIVECENCGPLFLSLSAAIGFP